MPSFAVDGPVLGFCCSTPNVLETTRIKMLRNEAGSLTLTLKFILERSPSGPPFGYMHTICRNLENLELPKATDLEPAYAH